MIQAPAEMWSHLLPGSLMLPLCRCLAAAAAAAAAAAPIASGLLSPFLLAPRPLFASLMFFCRIRDVSIPLQWSPPQRRGQKEYSCVSVWAGRDWLALEPEEGSVKAEKICEKKGGQGTTFKEKKMMTLRFISAKKI